jgi:Icc protein
LSRSAKDYVLLALHHQPVPVDAAWIDRYPLQEPAGFLKIVEADPRVRCVVWGHIHHHFETRRKGVLFLGAPSTAANSLPRAERFTLDPTGPACRWLELGSTGCVEFGQLYATRG